MPPELIRQCAALLEDGAADVATLASPIRSQEDFRNPNVVKVVVDNDDNALYFSRAAIPHSRADSTDELARETALHHHLEQLRALSLGMTIKVGRPVIRPGPGVDTEEDLLVAQRLLE